MLNQSIDAINKSLKAKTISVNELAQESILQARKKNPTLNCLLQICDDDKDCNNRINNITKSAQASIKAQELSSKNPDFNNLLTGIPIIYKDNFNVIDTNTTCASKILQNYVSPYNATVVELLNQQNMICIGKANMDEFAMGSTNENSAFGLAKNPFALNHCTGGSSGGSAAAVAAGIVPVAFGSDTGGSVRQPASFCGVTGVKPTYGRISRFGIIAFASSFDQAGIFTRSAYDNALVLSQVSKYDDKDSTSVNRPTDDYLTNINQSLKGRKIGLVQKLFDKVVDEKAKNLLAQAIETYKKLGVEFVDVELPDPELCVAAYYVLSSCECSSNLSRFDGVRYGYRSNEITDLESLYVKSRSEGFGSEVKRRILLGTFALSTGFYDAYYLKAQKMRRAILNNFLSTFTKVDAIMLPTSIITAPELGKDFDYNDDMCTITANLAGLPAMSHPIGFAENSNVKLPVGMQIIGKHFDEAFMYNLAHQYQQVTDFHTAIPTDI